MSDVYILNSVGESTPPCGTPVFIIACFDFLLLYIVNCFRPRKWFDRNVVTVLGMFVSVILCKCTVSIAIDMSSAIAIVLSGGFSALNPVVIVVLMVCRAVIVECFVLNPFWCEWVM